MRQLELGSLVALGLLEARAFKEREHGAGSMGPGAWGREQECGRRGGHTSLKYGIPNDGCDGWWLMFVCSDGRR